MTSDLTTGGAVAEPVRVRRLTDQEGRKLRQIVRRGSTSSVRCRRAMMLPASAGGNRVPVTARLVQADEGIVRVRTSDQRHALIRLGRAVQLRNASVLADERLLSRGAPAAGEVRGDRSTVALLTRADLGQVWPGRSVRMHIGDAGFSGDEPRPSSFG